jgi:hypothetical protein
MNPRVVVAFQGWSVCCFRGRVCGGGVDSAAGTGSCEAALARAELASASSFDRQQYLYLRPDPQ